ncbi:hypothetical protein [Streptomyces sp. HPF1205]|uniref:ParB/RepB/Spo0J family partition protein n=1 Tax=Streptomyces sp. HPF1205 TaxID=2873262 RepID=UPI001CED6573|nr:hypothetical protein [Streptomyces sp. HPF1205]
MPASTYLIATCNIHTDTAPLGQRLDAVDFDDLVDAVAGDRIVVRYVPSRCGYVLVMGETALREARRRGDGVVKVLVLNDSAYNVPGVLAAAVAERMARGRCSPLEETQLFFRLAAWHDVSDVATKCGVSAEHVENRLRLLTLCPAAEQALRDEKLPVELAERIAELTPGAQTALLDRWLGGHFSSLLAAEAAARDLAAAS